MRFLLQCPLALSLILEDGQIIGRLVYEPLTEVPSQVYGQAPTISGQPEAKQFRRYDPSKR